jgi:hypothetical protein
MTPARVRRDHRARVGLTATGDSPARQESPAISGEPGAEESKEAPGPCGTGYGTGRA